MKRVLNFPRGGYPSFDGAVQSPDLERLGTTNLDDLRLIPRKALALLPLSLLAPHPTRRSGFGKGNPALYDLLAAKPPGNLITSKLFVHSRTKWLLHFRD